MFSWTSRRRIVYLTSLGGKGRRLTVWPRHQTRTGRELFGSPSTSAACGSLPQPMWRAGRGDPRARAWTPRAVAVVESWADADGHRRVRQLLGRGRAGPPWLSSSSRSPPLPILPVGLAAAVVSRLLHSQHQSLQPPLTPSDHP
jgi:hypothetical protein